MTSKSTGLFVWRNLHAFNVIATPTTAPAGQVQIRGRSPSTGWLLQFLTQSSSKLTSLRSAYFVNGTCNRGAAALSRPFRTFFKAAASHLVSLTLDKSSEHTEQTFLPNPFSQPPSAPPELIDFQLAYLNVAGHFIPFETLQIFCENLLQLRELLLDGTCAAKPSWPANPPPAPPHISPNLFAPLTKLTRLRLHFGPGLAIASSTQRCFDFARLSDLSHCC